jgi:SAM-dependent MidA family methyltransferase
MDLQPGVRREPTFDPAAIESDPVLVERIRAEIRRDGPVTFARFMEVALYDPERGYYVASAARPTPEGDFVTAPELHPVVGRLIGRQLTEVWERLGRPDPFTLREPGAGLGTLGLSVVEGLRADGSGLAEAIVYEPLEVAVDRETAIRARFEAIGAADRVRTPANPLVGTIVANEALDALPTHRVVGGPDDELRELFVGLDGESFVEVAGSPSTPDLATRLDRDAVRLADGQVAEVCLALDGWVADQAAALDLGMLLVIDYGHEASALYGTARRDGTLRAYVGQRVHADPFRHVGRQDLTAHVDLTALDRAAEDAGLAVIGRTTQAEFVAGLGIAELLAEAGDVELAGGAAFAEYLALRAAVGRLLDPRALGAFAVRAYGRGIEAGPPLRGFGWRTPIRPAGRGGEPGR